MADSRPYTTNENYPAQGYNEPRSLSPNEPRIERFSSNSYNKPRSLSPNEPQIECYSTNTYNAPRSLSPKEPRIERFSLHTHDAPRSLSPREHRIERYSLHTHDAPRSSSPKEPRVGRFSLHTHDAPISLSPKEPRIEHFSLNTHDAPRSLSPKEPRIERFSSNSYNELRSLSPNDPRIDRYSTNAYNAPRSLSTKQPRIERFSLNTHDAPRSLSPNEPRMERFSSNSYNEPRNLSQNEPRIERFSARTYDAPQSSSPNDPQIDHYSSNSYNKPRSLSPSEPRIERFSENLHGNVVGRERGDFRSDESSWSRQPSRNYDSPYSHDDRQVTRKYSNEHYYDDDRNNRQMNYQSHIDDDSGKSRGNPRPHYVDDYDRRPRYDGSFPERPSVSGYQQRRRSPEPEDIEYRPLESQNSRLVCRDDDTYSRRTRDWSPPSRHDNKYRQHNPDDRSRSNRERSPIDNKYSQPNEAPVNQREPPRQRSADYSVSVIETEKRRSGLDDYPGDIRDQRRIYSETKDGRSFESREQPVSTSKSGHTIHYENRDVWRNENSQDDAYDNKPNRNYDHPENQQLHQSREQPVVIRLVGSDFEKPIEIQFPKSEIDRPIEVRLGRGGHSDSTAGPKHQITTDSSSVRHSPSPNKVTEKNHFKTSQNIAAAKLNINVIKSEPDSPTHNSSYTPKQVETQPARNKHNLVFPGVNGSQRSQPFGSSSNVTQSRSASSTTSKPRPNVVGPSIQTGFGIPHQHARIPAVAAVVRGLQMGQNLFSAGMLYSQAATNAKGPFVGRTTPFNSTSTSPSSFKPVNAGFSPSQLKGTPLQQPLRPTEVLAAVRANVAACMRAKVMRPMTPAQALANAAAQLQGSALRAGAPFGIRAGMPHPMMMQSGIPIVPGGASPFMPGFVMRGMPGMPIIRTGLRPRMPVRIPKPTVTITEITSDDCSSPVQCGSPSDVMRNMRRCIEGPDNQSSKHQKMDK